jgi:hypothetical protein
MFKSQLIKSNHTVLSKHRVYTHEAPVLSPDDRATFLVTEMCTDQYEHSI